MKSCKILLHHHIPYYQGRTQIIGRKEAYFHNYLCIEFRIWEVEAGLMHLVFVRHQNLFFIHIYVALYSSLLITDLS